MKTTLIITVLLIVQFAFAETLIASDEEVKKI